MDKVKNFCRRYFGEIALVVWLAVFMAFYLSVTSSHGILYGFIDGLIVNVVLAWVISYSIRTDIQSIRMQWGMFFVSAVMALAFWLRCREAVSDAYFYAILGVILCSFLCSQVIVKCSSLKIELESLKKLDYNLYLRRVVDLGELLSPEDEINILKTSEAPKLAAKYIKYCRFGKEAEKIFLKDQRFGDLWGEYFKSYALTDEEEMKLFELEHAQKIIGLYCSCTQMCERAELKLFSMSNAKEWVKMYIERGGFGSERAEKKLFTMPDWKDLADYYKSRYVVCNDVYRMLHSPLV